MKRLTIFVFLILSTVFLGFCSTKQNPIPQSINSFQLSRVIRGEEAKDFVNRLHFNSVTNEKNEIAFYRFKEFESIIYITHYTNELDAYNNLSKMARKISPQNSVFEKGKFLNLKGKNVYKTFGLGQAHFVFTHKKMLFWVSTEKDSSMKFLQSYLDYLY